eukprot:1887900-Amphidinium_carterae.1
MHLRSNCLHCHQLTRGRTELEGAAAVEDATVALHATSSTDTMQAKQRCDLSLSAADLKANCCTSSDN